MSFTPEELERIKQFKANKPEVKEPTSKGLTYESFIGNLEGEKQKEMPSVFDDAENISMGTDDIDALFPDTVKKEKQFLGDFFGGRKIGEAAQAKLVERKQRKESEKFRESLRELAIKNPEQAKELSTQFLEFDSVDSPEALEVMADTGLVALDILTLGKGKAVTAGVKKAGAEAIKVGGKAGFKKFLQNTFGKVGTSGAAIKETAQLGALGAGFGGLEQIKQGEGLEEALQGAKTGALIGAGGGLAVGAVGRQFANKIDAKEAAAKMITSKSDKQVSKAAQDLGIGEQTIRQVSKAAQDLGIGEQTIRQVTGKEKLVDEYIDQIDKIKTNPQELSPQGFMVSKFRKEVIDPLVKQKDKLGKAVDVAKKRIGTVDLTKGQQATIDNALDDALSTLKVVKEATEDGVKLVDKSPVKKAAEVQEVVDQIEEFKKNPRFGDLEDILKTLDDNISNLKLSKTGKAQGLGALEKLSRSLGKEIRSIRLSKMTNSEAATFKKFSILADILDGKKTPSLIKTKGATLSDVFGDDPLTGIKRVFSERDEATKRALGEIDKKLGTDILEYILDNQAAATLATKVYGTNEMQSLLTQAFQKTDFATEAAMAAATKGTSLIGTFASKVGNMMFKPNMEKTLKKVVKANKIRDIKVNLKAFENIDVTPDILEKRKKGIQSLSQLKKSLERAALLAPKGQKKELRDLIKAIELDMKTAEGLLE